VLGLRVLFSAEWVLGPVAVALYVAALAALAGAIVVGARRGTPEAFLLAAFPFLFALNPFGMSFGNLRYLVFLAPLLALPVIRVPVGGVVSSCLLAGLFALTALVLVEASSISDDVVGVVPDMDPVVDALDEAGVDRVWADYWIAYRLTFESDEGVIAAPTSVVRRYAPYEDAVRADEAAGWVTVTSSGQTEALRQAFAERDIDAEEIVAGEYTIFRPERPVLPDELPVAATNLVVL
jgi:hypothetical protein